MAFPVELNPWEIALLEERRQALGVASVADEAAPVAGGMMCFAGPVGGKHWANQAMGMGMEGPVEASEVERLIAFYDERGVEARLELCPHAHPTLIKALAERGFVVRDFDCVMARVVDGVAPMRLPEGVWIEQVEPADEAAVEAFIHIRSTGFGEKRDDVYERIERRLLAHPRCRCLIARVDGEPAAAAVCEFMPPTGCLFGATTLTPFRRRGLQSALMHERVRLAAEAACGFVCIGSAPGGPTQRNALRLGFHVMYTKLTLARAYRSGAAAR